MQQNSVNSPIVSKKKIFVAWSISLAFLAVTGAAVAWTAWMMDRTDSVFSGAQAAEYYGIEFERLEGELSNLETMLQNTRPIELESRAMAGLDEAFDPEAAQERLQNFPAAASMAMDTRARALVATALSTEDLLQQTLAVKSSYEEVLDRIASRHDGWSNIPSLCPVDHGRLSSHFGWRRDPFTGRPKRHFGIDLTAPTGTPILAPAAGTVVRSSYLRGYGLLVDLNHGNDLTTRYAHLSRFAVNEGETVERGQVIGYVGATGRASAPHLHYEVLVQGARVDPRPYIFADGHLAE